MRIQKGLCIGTETFGGCGDERYIVNKTRKLCDKCNSKRLKESSSVQKTERFELQLFIQIWNERPHLSEVSGLPLKQFNICYFSHVLSKGAYPKYRLKKENIILKTMREHNDWHTKAESDLKQIPMWQPIFELRDKLKTQYNQEI